MARFINPPGTGDNADVGDFEFDGSTMSTFDDMSILVTGVPGEISLSAYAGITLQYHEDYGVFLRDNTVPTNKVASIGDIGVETEYAVQGGTSGTQPTFDGDPLFSASYVRMSSNLVHFQIQVDMDNITNFGTGQYYMTLPFNAKHGYMFREGCLHDVSRDREYHISGHVEAGSNVLELYTTDVQFATRIYDFPFSQGEPITLTSADNFHISGTYIAED